MNPKTGKRQLFDLENDRAETRDVLAEHPEVAERLGEKLAAWKKSLPLKPDASALSASRAKKAGTKKTEVSGSCG